MDAYGKGHPKASPKKHRLRARGLRSRQLVLAAMDATEPEPLPPDHPPRKTDSVLISPHDVGLQRHAVRFEENLNACLAGKALPGAARHGRLR